jgi:hypothetical protein
MIQPIQERTVTKTSTNKSNSPSPINISSTIEDT